MKIEIELPDYDGNAMDVIWEENSKYIINIHDDSVDLLANKDGLISIAKQMLYMAYNDLSEGSYVHYDSFLQTRKALSF